MPREASYNVGKRVSRLSKTLTYKKKLQSWSGRKKDPDRFAGKELKSLKKRWKTQKIDEDFRKRAVQNRKRVQKSKSHGSTSVAQAKVRR